MICGRSDNRVARQFIDLHEERGDDPLYFTGLMNVASLFSNGIKLIKKKHARDGAGIIKNPFQSSGRFPQITADHCLVANHKKRDRNRLSDRFGQCRLSGPRLSDEKDAVARLEPMAAQYVSAVLLLDQ